MKEKTSCELRGRWAIEDERGRNVYKEFIYRFDRLAKLVGRLASPSSVLERLIYIYIHTYIRIGRASLTKIYRIVMYKWQEAVNSNDRSYNWMNWSPNEESVDWSGSLDRVRGVSSREWSRGCSAAVSKDGEESEEREVAQTWKDRICVPVRFLLRGSATCLRTYIRALDTSAPTDHESANRSAVGDVYRATGRRA